MWTKNLGKDGDYVCHSGGWDYHLKLPGVQKFNDDYKAAYGDNPEPPAGSAYVCVQVLADALERAGTLNRDKVRDAHGSDKYDDHHGADEIQTERQGRGKVPSDDDPVAERQRRAYLAQGSGICAAGLSHAAVEQALAQSTGMPDE